MTINKIKDGEKLTIAINGRLDTITAPDLDKEVKEGIDGVTELVFDMKDLDYISSAGLRVLLSAQKIMNKKGNMTVTNCADSILDIFEITGFSEVLTVV